MTVRMSFRGFFGSEGSRLRPHDGGSPIPERREGWSISNVEFDAYRNESGAIALPEDATLVDFVEENV